MKSIILMNGKEKIIADDEGENVKQALLNGNAKFLKLRDGSIINTSSIVSVDEVELVPYWSQYRVYETKQGQYIIREGEKCFLDAKNIGEIKYLMPKEYEQNPEVIRQLEGEKKSLIGEHNPQAK